MTCPFLVFALISRLQDWIFCCNVDILKSPRLLLQDGKSPVSSQERFRPPSGVSAGRALGCARGAERRGGSVSIWTRPPRCPRGEVQSLLPLPSHLPRLKQEKDSTSESCRWICSQEPSPIPIRLSAPPPPPAAASPSLTKGKKEPEPQLEIYHAIVYHEFLVNHIGEAGLFISETLNQYKVGLLVLKLGWSVKK